MTHMPILRPETLGDVKAISKITQRAFENHPHSDQREHILVEKLRKTDALSISLIAEMSGQIVGHIAFSEITINGEKWDWFGLAPVSVDPEFQNNGIGSLLIKRGLEKLREKNAKGCVLLGEPEYYNRFGFDTCEGLTLPDVPTEYFMALSFSSSYPTGIVKYHDAFSGS
jgi:putative acetyltransferase